MPSDTQAPDSLYPDIFGAVFANDPWSHFERMRLDAPLSKVRVLSGIPAWLVTDYAAAKFVLSDPRFLLDGAHIGKIIQRHSKNNPSFYEYSENLESHMLSRDAPDHTRLRKLSMKAFTPKTVAGLSTRIKNITTYLLEKFPLGQEFDIGQYLSYPLPITMICEILGIPEEQRADFTHWSAIIMNQAEDNTDFTAILHARNSISDLLTKLITTKQTQLYNTESQDLLDELILARDKEDKLTNHELISTALLLLVAGHETTVSLINNAVVRLCKHPKLADQLRVNPTLIPTFVEEVLRLDPPVHFSTFRFASESLTIGDQHIDADDLIIVSLLAANYDPQVYPDPQQITLENKVSHLAFGHGSHFCLGAALARNEAVTAITDLLQQFSSITLAVPESELIWRPSYTIRTRKAVPVVLQQ